MFNLFNKSAHAGQIEINLVPDIKRRLLETQRKQIFVTSLSFMVGAASIAVVIFLFLVVTGQKALTSNQEKEIKQLFAEIKNSDRVEYMLTIQNQMSVLNGLHGNKPIESRLMNLIEAITPRDTKVSFSKISFDLATYVVTLEGQGENFLDHEKLIKTIDMTEFSYPAESEEGKITEERHSILAEGTRPSTPDSVSKGVDSTGQSVVTFKVLFTINQDLFKNSYFKKDDPSEVTLKINPPTGEINVTDSVKFVLTEKPEDESKKDGEQSKPVSEGSS